MPHTSLTFLTISVCLLAFSPRQALAGAEPVYQSLEEVVVTARRQDESAQEVPVSITSISGEQLQRYQIDQFQEIAARTPGLNVQTGGGGSGGTISLRGIGSSSISAAFDSAVGLDIDGVQISRMRMVQAAFLDIEQVDILKGPQSLYFGKSATAGVVSFRSADPTQTLQGKLGGGYDPHQQAYYADGFISGPLTETLGARLAMRYAKADEIWRNTAPGRSSRFGEKDLNARLTLAWQPSEAVNLNFKTSIARHDADDAIGNIDLLCAVPGNPQASSFAGLSLPSGYDCNADDGRTVLAGHNDIVNDNFSGNVELTPFEELDTSLTRLQADWKINDRVNLTTVTSYFVLEEEGAGSFGYDRNGIGSSYAVNETRSFAQELRLQVDIAKQSQLMLGAYYQDRTLLFESGQEVIGAANIAALIGLPTADPVSGFTEDWFKVHDTRSTSWSVFGSLTLQATQRLEIAAGLRYSSDERISDIEVPSIHYILDLLGLGFVSAGYRSGDIKFDDTQLSPELSLLYVLNDNINLYAAYKTGYKAGGVDNSALPSGSLAVAAASGDFEALIYDTEEAAGVEVGVKTRFDTEKAGSFALDLTAFRYTYEDLQAQSFNINALQFNTGNAGEVRSQGLEADFTWVPDVEGWSVYGTLAFLNTQFNTTYIPEVPLDSMGQPVQDPVVLAQYDLNGRSLTGAADFAFNAGFDYIAPLGGTNLQWGFGLNTTYSDDYETQDEDPIGFVQDGFWLLNARLSLGDADGSWQVSVLTNNLLDKLYVTASGGRPFADTSNNTLLPGGFGFSDTVLDYARRRQVFAQFELRL